MRRFLLKLIINEEGQENETDGFKGACQNKFGAGRTWEKGKRISRCTYGHAVCLSV